MDEDEFEVLTEKAPLYGVKISPHQLDLFRAYVDELWEWNLQMNLTGLSSRSKIVIELLFDSLIPAPHIPTKEKMLDVGSGAGFPAIPLKILIPSLKMTLIEANSKKVSFLKHINRQMNLSDIEVIRGRIEQGRLEDRAFSLITARAIAGLGQTLSWCGPHLCEGGLMIGFLGPHAERDLTESLKVMEVQGLVLHKKITYILPTKKTERNAVIFRKE